MFDILTLLQISGETATNGFDAIQKVSLRLICRLLIDFTSVVLLIKLVYFPRYRRTELNFTFFIFNLVIFLICFLLNKVDLSMGAAFGLFAVFSMLRYRTEEISIKDMTYLFLVIAIGLVSAVTKIKDASDALEYLFLACINTGIILIAFFLESRFLSAREGSKTIVYENIALINAGKEVALIADIKARTGLNVNRISVMKIDFVNDSALIKIFYFEP